MTTRTVTVSDFQTRLPQILSMVSAGDVIILSEGDQPFAKIVPIIKHGKQRIAGLNKDKIKVGSDFDEALPDDFWLGSR